MGGVFLGVFGGSRGVTGCLVDPYRTLFAPLEDLYGTRFSSKHHILVQLAYVNRVALLTHFRTLGAPLGVPKAPLYEQIMPFCQSFEAQNGPKSGLLAPEMSSDCPE